MPNYVTAQGLLHVIDEMKAGEKWVIDATRFACPDSLEKHIRPVREAWKGDLEVKFGCCGRCSEHDEPINHVVTFLGPKKGKKKRS